MRQKTVKLTDMGGIERRRDRPQEPLSEDKALDEANMVRGLLAEWRGWLRDGQHSRADYERAQQTVDAIRKEAEGESDAQKMLYQTARILHNIGRVPLGAIMIMDYALAVDKRVLSGSEKPRETGYFLNEGFITPMLREIDRTLAEKLTDQEKKLKQLEKKGAGYARRLRKEDIG